MLEFAYKFENIQELETEFEKNLKVGGTFVKGNFSIEVNEPCLLVLIHPTTQTQKKFKSRVVWKDTNGIGLTIMDFNDEVRDELKKFVLDKNNAGLSNSKKTLDIQKKLRGLSITDQIKVAKSQNQSERTILERIYGKSIWEHLLRNPNISIPEVARIAKMGSLPFPLVELIVSNPSWIAVPLIRRSLFANPRLRGNFIDKVLHAMPRSELKLVPRQTTYSAQVKQIAKRMLSL